MGQIGDSHPAGGRINPDEKKAKFLELYPDIANIGVTCALIGMTRRAFYHWTANDPDFVVKFKIADAMALSTLEDEAHRRAVTGVKRPVYQSGREVGSITEYSDTLLIVLLKARAPHKYKERFSGELTGANGQPLIPETKLIHVHSHLPLATDESEIIEGEIIPYETDLLGPPNLNTSELDNL